MPSPPSCQLCHPASLERLLQTEPQVRALWTALPPIRLQAGRTLLRAGETVDRCWWVQKGLLRSFYLDDRGLERNRAFHAENDWLGHGLPPLPAVSPLHIETLEDSTLVCLPYDILRDLQLRHPALEPLLQEARNSMLMAVARREASLLAHTPAERYQAFRQDHAALQERIALHHVASYLGISNVSLSRIRARLGMIPGR